MGRPGGRSQTSAERQACPEASIYPVLIRLAWRPFPDLCEMTSLSRGRAGRRLFAGPGAVPGRFSLKSLCLEAFGNKERKNSQGLGLGLDLGLETRQNQLIALDFL